MINLSRQYDDYIMDSLDAALIAPNQLMRPRVMVYDGITGQVKEKWTELITGLVTVDVDSDPHRRLEITIVRPKTTLSPGDLWLNDLYQAFYEIYVKELDSDAYDHQDGGWISIPVFAGLVVPGSIRKSEQDSSIVTITAFGFEQRYMYPLGVVMKIQRGAKHSTGVRQILNNYDYELWGSGDQYTWPHPGETGPHTPEVQTTPGQLLKPFYYGSEIIEDNAGRKEGIVITPWQAIKRLANGAGGYVARFDSNFRFHLHKQSYSPVAKFTKSEANVIGLPETIAELTNFVNRIVVWGAQPEGKAQIRGEATAYAPYRPEDLKWLICEEFSESEATSKKAADALAKKLLKDKQVAELTISVDTFTEPRLEVGDYIQVANPGGDEYYTVPAKAFTIPLTTDAAQSITSSRKRKAHRLLNLGARKVKR